MKEFSKKLKELRLENGQTQAQVAEKLNIRQQTYARYENNTGEPSLDTLVKISEIFDVSCDFLLGKTNY